jgi:hypothetical protein
MWGFPASTSQELFQVGVVRERGIWQGRPPCWNVGWRAARPVAASHLALTSHSSHVWGLKIALSFCMVRIILYRSLLNLRISRAMFVRHIAGLWTSEPFCKRAYLQAAGRYSARFRQAGSPKDPNVRHLLLQAPDIAMTAANGFGR